MFYTEAGNALAAVAFSLGAQDEADAALARNARVDVDSGEVEHINSTFMNYAKWAEQTLGKLMQDKLDVTIVNVTNGYIKEIQALRRPLEYARIVEWTPRLTQAFL